MMRTTALYRLKAFPILFALLCSTPSGFAQTDFPESQEISMGVLKGCLVKGPSQQPVVDIKVRLIGFTGEALTNSRGEFFLEAPARTYSGLVIELPQNGETRLIEESICLEKGQLVNLDSVSLESPIEKEPLEMPLPESPTLVADTDGNQRPVPSGNRDAVLLAMSNTGMSAPVRETADPLVGTNSEVTVPNFVVPDEAAPSVGLDPILVRARSLVTVGDYFNAGRAYEEYLSRFPLDGPVAVEYGVMVFHNIQNAQGRTLLKQAAQLPGLRPIDIETLNAFLSNPVVVVERPDRRESHARIRLRARHRSCH